MTLSSTDKILLEIDDDLNKLRYNSSVTIEVGKNADMKSYSGKVVTAYDILPSDVSEDRTLVALDENISPDLLTGDLMYRSISEEASDILQIDRRAVKWEDQKAFVYVLDGDMVQKRYVTAVQNSSDNVWILDGLSEGQTLIVE